MTKLRCLLLPLVALVAALACVPALAAPAGAAARASHDCPARTGTIVKAPLGRVWHRGSVLYGCTTVFGIAPRTKRLGPWTRGTRVAFDGVGVAWTARHTVGGETVDRAWAASTQTGRRWLTGAPLVPASGATPGREGRSRWVALTDEGAAWITRAGDVVFALHSPDDAPAAIGTLPGPLVPGKHLLLVGSWPSVPAAALAASAELKELDGDGDECGGANDYRLTVQPEANGPRIGAIWNGSWERPDCG